MNKEQFPFILIDENSSIPIYRQIYESIRQAILDGKLQPKTRLPATRLLAARLGVARTTIISAYEQLFAEGYLEGKTGSGTFVAARLPEDFLNAEKPQTERDETKKRPVRLSELGRYLARNGETILRPYNTQTILPFRHGIPAMDEFPFEIWAKILQKQVRSSDKKSFSYGDVQGYPPLREAIAGHLAQSRGVHCSAQQIVITSGTQQTLDLIGSIFLSRNDEICLEDPTYFGARDVFAAIGVKIIPVPVDREGFDLTAARNKSRAPRLIYVTPSHQYPLGVTMSLARRMNLLEWARETGSIIVEDDYDSEYRYAGRPLGSLQGLDRHDLVIYTGTFSKTVFPALRLGFLVAPPDLVEMFKAAKALRDWHSPQPDQAVLAEFITDGHFARHLRRMREIYQERQQVLVEEAAKQLDGLLDVSPSTSGMHLIGWLPEGVDDTEIFFAARKENLQIAPLSASCLERKLRGGFFLGYTAFNKSQIRTAIKKLREILSAKLHKDRPE